MTCIYIKTLPIWRGIEIQKPYSPENPTCNRHWYSEILSLLDFFFTFEFSRNSLY